ncbi:MAG: EAL domain-containing protein [Gallionella sp.]|nr:EAL domain-containing protein [Gallionella sp.]
MYLITHIPRFFLTLLLLLTMTCAQAEKKEISIGVLSFRPLAQTEQQWQPMADYLNQRIPEYHFNISVHYYKELDLATNRHEFDFVFTNPEHYITIRADYSLYAIATLMPLAEGYPVTQFGGVILARADRNDINTLSDVRGKIVASPAEQSLGGYLMQRWVLFKQNVGVKELKQVHFTGMPHDKAVMEVLNGVADVGFVRTGILENMAREGKIRLDQFKILNQQPLTHFPQQRSTDLYPEWPIAAMPDVPDSLVKQVTLALLQIRPEDLVAQKGKFYGFAPAGNYAAVEAMMERLKVNPERAHEFDLRDVTRKYAPELISGGLLLLLGMVATAIYLARTNRRLIQSTHERELLDEELRLANSSLELKVTLRTHELQQSEARFRHMFEHHASPMLLLDPDTGMIVNANQAAASFYGYTIEQMTQMTIYQINVMSKAEIDAERGKAQQEDRGYFVFPHRLANGTIRTVEVHSSPFEVQGRALSFSIIHDITERRQMEEQMHDLAFYDALTKLPNRRLLLDRLGKSLVSAARMRRHGALMFLDLDHFKMLNDLHGHDVGDMLLVEVAARLLHCIREQDSAARLGGDEFVVLLDGLSEKSGEAVVQAESVAEKVRTALSQPYVLKRVGEDDPIVHHCSSSIGVTVFCEHDETLEQLLKWTDMAMYRAKDAGRNAIRFFDPDMQTAIELRAALEADLHTALAQDQFRLFYQVQVNASGKPIGAEALLRWQHPLRGLVSPAEFIPMAEESGLIVPIGTWVLNNACAQIKRWQQDKAMSNLSFAVNVSAKQFQQPSFVAEVMMTVRKYGIKPLSLKIELTESTVLVNVDETIAKMSALKEIGVLFSMDDFGTGYSSLSYLKRLPLDQLKIDQSFVREITSDAADSVMVMTLVDLGMNFELDVIAEGVETEAQLKVLRRCGCGNYQGYLFSRPVPVEQFEQVVHERMLPK